MPFYEYQCKSCGHELEAMQKVSDPPMKKCPHCGKSQLQRLMSAPVFRLKGAGWYETDFKGDQDKKRNLADRPEAESSKEPAAGTEGQGETKAGESKSTEASPSESKKIEGSASNEGSASKLKPSQKAAAKTPKRMFKSPAKRVPAKTAKKTAAKSKRRR